MERIDLVSKMMNSVWTTKNEEIHVSKMTENQLRTTVHALYAKDVFKEDEPIRKSWVMILEDELKHRGYTWSENILWWFKKR